MPSRRKTIYLIAVAAMLLLVLGGWALFALRGQADVGAAYGARMTCSCRYVEGRAMGSCQDDKEPGMAMVRLNDLPDEKAVEASVPLMAKHIARFRPGWGCLLDPKD